MLSTDNDDYTPAGVTKSSRCSGCGSVDSACFAYPATNVSRIMCLECIRGMVVAVTRELRRKRVTGLAKTE